MTAYETVLMQGIAIAVCGITATIALFTGAPLLILLGLALLSFVIYMGVAQDRAGASCAPPQPCTLPLDPRVETVLELPTAAPTEVIVGRSLQAPDFAMRSDVRYATGERPQSFATAVESPDFLGTGKEE